MARQLRDGCKNFVKLLPKISRSVPTLAMHTSSECAPYFNPPHPEL
jgi:hypothetical protein